MTPSWIPLASVAVPALGAALLMSLPRGEARLARLVVAAIAALALASAALGGLSFLSAAAPRGDGTDPLPTVLVSSLGGWVPWVLPGAAAGGGALALELDAWRLPAITGGASALLMAALAWPPRERPGAAAAGTGLGRMALALALGAVAITGDDLLVAVAAWAGMRLALALALRAEVAPAGRRPIDDRVGLTVLLAFGLFAAVVAGGMAHFDLSDGHFVTGRASLAGVHVPIATQRWIGWVLVVVVASSVGVPPLHRGWRACFDQAPLAAATAFVIELGVTLALVWGIGTALAPVALGELADTMVAMALVGAVWAALVARVRRGQGAALLAVASYGGALVLLGLGLGRGASLTGAALVVLGLQVGLPLAAAVRTVEAEAVPRPGIETADRPLGSLGVALALGAPPSPVFVGLCAVVPVALVSASSQMRWAPLLAAGILVAGVLAAVAALVRARGRGPALAGAPTPAPVPGALDPQGRAASRSASGGVLALVAVAAVVVAAAGPFTRAVALQAAAMDRSLAEARCAGVAARTLRYPAWRAELPVECDDAHRSLRRAYGLDGPTRDPGPAPAPLAGEGTR